ncbi:hypothetical protein Bca52824_036835 [Brassica carinata]|uniref:Uncharacterized protein n=1 Tax=Brassica carinata TaxID=52824 RepID=A0A8X7S6Q9_BRACI|nr:hypothetical protein Bca52824_036835 [Brassica carinata]
MPVSFNHPQTSRSVSHHPPSLPHLVGRSTLTPCVCGIPLFSRASVPVLCYLLRTSSSWNLLTRSSSTNSRFDGPLRDSEKTRCTALPLCLAEGPIYSGGPISPCSEAHRLSLDGRLSISAVCSISDVAFLSFPLFPTKRHKVGPRVSPKWTWTARLTDFASPKTRYPNQRIKVLNLLKIKVLGLACLIRFSGGFTGAFSLRIMTYYLFKKILLVHTPRRFPLHPSSSLEEMTFLSCFLPMEEDVYSDLLPSISSSFITDCLSCVAVCTGPEDTTKITMCYLAGEGWPSTSHYVTKFQMSDAIGKASSTHPSLVLNTLSSSFEDLSFLIWFDICVCDILRRKYILEIKCKL